MRNLPRREQVAARLHRFASRIVLVKAQDDLIETEELAVTLTSGKVFRYAQVPLQAFNNFRDAESAGKHYNAYFKTFFKQVA